MKNLIVVRLAVIIATIVIAPSCSDSPDSGLKHTYGVTTSAIPNPDLGNCVEQGTSYTEARAYLKAIMMHITKGNPNTFSGRFSADKFCIDINPSKVANATLSPNGRLEFNIGMFQALDSDAAIAAIMAHELAHITMAHAVRAIDDKFDNDPEIKSLQSQLISKLVALQKAMKDGLVTLRTLFKKRSTTDSAVLKSAVDDVIKLEAAGEAHSPLIDAYLNYFALVVQLSDPELGSTKIATPYSAADIKQVQDLASPISDHMESINTLKAGLIAKRKAKGATAEELANWREQEADEVGFELYLRSGFKADSFTDLFSHLLEEDEAVPSLTECQRKLDADLIPDRGQSTHPANCWRIYDIKKAEKQRHSNEYDSYYKTNTIVNLFPGRLSSVYPGMEG